LPELEQTPQQPARARRIRYHAGMTVTATLIAVALMLAASAAGCWLERHKAKRELERLERSMKSLAFWAESGAQ
tara:strand:- start:1157 stop:1378 length:222 start_codon:yes stop_codon:yes gene_type:complete